MDLEWPGVLSRDGQWIVITTHSHIQVWRVTETVTKTNELSTDYVRSLALLHDGSRVVIGYKDGRIQVWNHLTNKTECQMSGHSRTVECVAFSYDGSRVVSGSNDQTVQIWDCHTGNQVTLYQHLSWVVTSVAFSHDGGHVAFGSCLTVWIWDTSTGEIHSKPDNIWRLGTVHSIAFSHDDSHVIFGWTDVVWIWNVMTNEVTELSG